MLTSIRGVYKDGKVELLESAPSTGEAQVIITFLPANGPVDLSARGIDQAQAADLRARLKAFAPDWDRPDMDAYDAS